MEQADGRFYQESAVESERLALVYCEMGEHGMAAWRFYSAGCYYAASGQHLKAAKMFAQEEVERQQVRPARPVNVSGLVD